MVKRIMMGVLLVIVAIQFVRPERNQADGLGEADISLTYAIPDNVYQILQNKCYDCHSNNTNYPWYYNLQPVAWWMAHHVSEGKQHLNFSDYKNYREGRATHKLEEVMEQIAEDEMPLKSYRIMHPDAKVTSAERDAINTWIKSLGVIKPGEDR